MLPVPPRRAPSSRWLLAVWVCFLLRGTFYCAALPLWEGWDEFSHYAYVDHLLGHGGSLPKPGVDRNSREVEASLDIGPVAWSIHQMLPHTLPYERFWELPVEERRAREQRLSGLPARWRSEEASTGVLYEAQQPPLYYWLMALPLRMADGWSLVSRVFWLRMWTLLLASLVVPLGFAVARRLLADDRLAVALMASVAALPGLMINLCRVSNEGPAVVLFALLLLAVVKLCEQPGCLRTWLLAGAALGGGLLTKAYFLAEYAAFPVLAGWLLWRNRAQWKRIAGGCLAAMLVAALAAGWWYRFIYLATGTFTGQIQTVDLRYVGFAAKLTGLVQMNWRQVLDTIALSHVWFGGWSFLQLRSWIYHLCNLFLMAGIAGCVLLLVRPRRGSPEAPVAHRLLAACGFGLGPLLAALFYHALVTFLTIGQTTTNGWYLDAVVVAEALLLYAGIVALLPHRARDWVTPAAALGAAAIDIYGMLFLLLPYYHGIIGHLPDGRLQTFYLSSLRGWSSSELIERLTFNRPFLAGGEAFLVLALLWLLATLALPATAWRNAIKGRSGRPRMLLRLRPDRFTGPRQETAIPGAGGSR